MSSRPAILPDGSFSLIRWHLYVQRTALAGKLRDILGEGAEGGAGRTMTVEEKVEALAWARLRGNEGVVGRWQEVCFYLPAISGRCFFLCGVS
jgi:ubiquinone biosynthesis protein COQ9